MGFGDIMVYTRQCEGALSAAFSAEGGLAERNAPSRDFCGTGDGWFQPSHERDGAVSAEPFVFQVLLFNW